MKLKTKSIREMVDIKLKEKGFLNFDEKYYSIEMCPESLLLISLRPDISKYGGKIFVRPLVGVINYILNCLLHQLMGNAYSLTAWTLTTGHSYSALPDPIESFSLSLDQDLESARIKVESVIEMILQIYIPGLIEQFITVQDFLEFISNSNPVDEIKRFSAMLLASSSGDLDSVVCRILEQKNGLSCNLDEWHRFQNAVKGWYEGGAVFIDASTAKNKVHVAGKIR